MINMKDLFERLDYLRTLEQTPEIQYEMKHIQITIINLVQEKSEELRKTPDEVQG